ncbi:hypothetical protein GS501_09505 [Saccharibacter sp. 17.LH.SD]|uniref:hypothetical protein n=1 Tax=Saccharibacter sp. 17.LH.SD TaxID=2689393 RepID=UPI00136F7617|nr:hypothetical protein [Saccharibacter sp. 17.LH.SD]MXV45266.1 hypothetical protein [Saccharibacter sp. 17.LH.SD]
MNASLLAQLSIDHKPVDLLYPGWEAVSRHPAPGGMDVVLFRENKSGREACWWVTPGGSHLASHALALPPEHKDALTKELDPILQPIMEHSLVHKPLNTLPVENTTFQTLTALPTTALTEIISLWVHHAAPNTVIIDPQEFLQDINPEDEDADSPFSSTRIKQVMESRCRGDAPPILSSPFSKMPLKAQLVMNHRAGVTGRFFDPTEQLTFYIFWPNPSDPQQPDAVQPPTFYYPQGPLIFGQGYTAHMLPTWLMIWFIHNPDHAEHINAAPSFQLEDYGIGKISNIWDSFSHTLEESNQDKPHAFPPSHTQLWNQWSAPSLSRKDKDKHDDNS